MSKATPARCGGQVRRRGQDRREEGSRPSGDRLRQRLRGPGRDGRRSRADAAGVSRGRGLRRTIARDRLQPLHRPWHRDAKRARPAVPRGGKRLLASHPLRPGGACRRRQPVPARLAQTADPARRLHRTGSCATRRSPTPIPPEAERLGALAQEAVNQRWETYEEMATRPAHRFPADARRSS